MRLFSSVSFLVLTLAAPALAEVVSAGSTITAVTLFPEGAEVTRRVQVDLPAGAHELRIADLPQGIDPGLIRLAATEGTGLGAFSVQQDGLAPGETVALPALDQAVAAARAARDAADQALGAVMARIAAAEAREGFLRGLETEGGSQTPEGLAAMARMVGVEVLAARQEILALNAERAPLDLALSEAEARLAETLAARDDARARLADAALLVVAVSQQTAGPAEITLRHFVSDATWRPVYDVNLTRKPAPALSLSRGVLVSQNSGEDWRDVALTLSTSRPSDQAAPSDLWPDLRRVEKPRPVMPLARAAEAEMMGDAVALEATPVPMVVAQMLEGEVVQYRAPMPVSVATGVQDLRIALSELALTPEVEARAVPRYDSTAFLMAHAVNGAEALLPGTAYLLRDGVLVGSTDLGLIAAGDKIDLPFGPIDGLRLTREMPRNSEGDAGFFASGTARKEAAVLRVENLTDEVWPIHLVDQVPYSEQEELEISFVATPAPDETDPEGRRGLLGWHFDLAPGDTHEVTLEADLRWPSGMELR